LYKGGYAIKQYNSEKHFNEEPCITLANLKAKKVIATTDNNISINLGKEKWIAPTNSQYDQVYTRLCPYPQPSPQFIEKFVKSFNEGNIISEVMVEYESYCIYGDNCPSQGAFLKQHLCNINYKLKTDSNNYITITKVKDSWSREKVEQLLFKYAEEEHSWFSSKSEIESFNNWIEKNL